MIDLSTALSLASQSTGNSAGGNKAAQSLAGNFDTFLSLLTTQLKNQDPSNPLDTNQFTQQLIQYSEVEQQLKSNKMLEALVQMNAAGASLSLVNYVGREISYEGNQAHLANGKSARWSIDMPSSVQNATFIVKDAGGNEVYSSSGQLAAGHNSFSWDGRKSDGSQAPEGEYSLTINATDANGASIAPTIGLSGQVEGVDLTGDDPVLLVNGTRITLDKVREIHLASS